MHNTTFVIVKFFQDWMKTMKYPKSIADYENHEKWTHENLLNIGITDETTEKYYDDLEFVKAYYHSITPILKMHSHNFYEINIITEGRGRHYIEGKSCEAEKGMVFVIPPDIKHGYYTLDNLTVFHIVISSIFMNHYAEDIKHLPGYTMLFEIEPLLRGEFNTELFLKLSDNDFERLSPLFERLWSVFYTNIKGQEILKNSITLNLISEFSLMISNEIKSKAKIHISKNQLDIVKSMEYIRNNYGNKISTEQLAKDVGMSYSAYLRHFKEVAKCTPGKYLNMCRLEKAKELLSCTDASIVDIAVEIGFYDSSHFIRSFYEETGKNPAEYRKSK